MSLGMSVEKDAFAFTSSVCVRLLPITAPRRARGQTVIVSAPEEPTNVPRPSASMLRLVDRLKRISFHR